ncbi:hypothetical protein [Ktedonospora formicarum]|uniref:hypothetical protein n=1 Tax=Ktedonospora formicarum TaxID=2778364 RepID=UPI001C68F2B9|nr:hypothetical protein [Ktedonospora formicarum]
MSTEKIEDDKFEAALPSIFVVDHDLPVPGSIIRNLLSTRMRGDLSKTLEDAEPESGGTTFSSKETASTDSSTDVVIPAMADNIPQTLGFIPLAHNKPAKRKRPLYSIFIAAVVILLLLGGLGTTFFLQQRTQGLPREVKQSTPIVTFENTTILSSPTPGHTATTKPGQTATTNPKVTPSPVSTSQPTPTIVPTQGVTPVPTKAPIPPSLYQCSFEDGQLEGWAPRSSPNVYVQNSTNVARDGSHSLMVTFASSDNYPHISTTPTNNPPYKGQVVSGYVYVAAGSNVRGRMYILDQNMNGFIGGQDLISLPTGSWYYLSYQIGSWAQGSSTRVGFEFSGSNVVVYVDSVNW